MRIGAGGALWRSQCRTSAAIASSVGSRHPAAPIYGSIRQQHASSVDARLINRFGPQAKVVVRETASVHAHRSAAEEEDDQPSDEAAAAASIQQRRRFRASVTFRQLGFPVEIASVTAPTAIEAESQAVEIAMSSNIFFIKPQPARDNNTRGNNSNSFQQQDRLPPQAQEIKRIIETLRHVSTAHGRVLKFAVRRNATSPKTEDASSTTASDAPALPSLGQWSCRAYVRDDWSANTKPMLAAERTGSTPNDALVATFRFLSEGYKAELESPEVEQEDLLEVNRLLALEDREAKLKCYATATEQQLDQAQQASRFGQVTTGFAGSVTVLDEFDNHYSLQCKNQTTKQLTYRNLSQQVYEREQIGRDDVVASAFHQPLLVKLRWELEGLAEEVARTLANPDGSLKYSPGGVVPGTKNSLDALVITDETFISPDDAAVPATADHLTYKCSIVFDGTEIAAAESKGSYRVEFDCHSNALYYLLDRYGEVAERRFFYLFPSAELLERSIRHHDGFKVVQHHRGKWNCYSVLGTILNNLVGSFYNTQYKELDLFGSKFCATLVYNDGARFEQPLISRSSTMRGDAWKNACMDAIRENFPVQYASAKEMEDFDLSNDTTARGSKYKSLPREKRIQHVNNLFSVILAFAEEDYGWTNIEIKVRGAPGESQRWIAELEANVHGERERRVVYSSPPHQQAKYAKRLLTFLVAKKFFPKELRVYTRLGRPDALNPEEVERQGLAQIYQASTPFAKQVVDLLNRHKPDQRPITFKVERFYSEASIRQDNDGSTEDLVTFFNPRFKASLFGRDGQTVIVERLGDEKEGPLSVLRSVLLSACKAYVTSDESKLLFSEYERCVPPNVSSPRDLSVYMFSTFIGGDMNDDERQPTFAVDTVFFELREWVATVVLPMFGHLAIARVSAMTKKEAVRQAIVVATRQNFQHQLRKFSRTSLEVQAFSDDILNEEISDRPPQSSSMGSGSGGGAMSASTNSAMPLPPGALLRECVERDDPGYTIRHEQNPNPGCGFTCRIFRVQKAYLPTASVKGSAASRPQEIGRGTALTKPQSLHLATITALENLFEEDLRKATEKCASYCDLPPPQ